MRRQSVRLALTSTHFELSEQACYRVFSELKMQVFCACGGRLNRRSISLVLGVALAAFTEAAQNLNALKEPELKSMLSAANVPFR